MKPMGTKVDRSVMVRVCWAFLLSVAIAGGVRAAENPVSAEGIIGLARAGHNAEAIAAYEALPKDFDAPLTLLRAVAGCYWRERQFEQARDLYQRILERRPTLKGLSEAPVAKSAAPTPLLERPAVADDPAVKPPAPVETPVKSDTKPEAPVAEAAPVTPAIAPPPSEPKAPEVAPTDPAMQAELDDLRAEYSVLEESGSRRREELLARIDMLELASVQASAEMDEIRRELSSERGKREALETTARVAEDKLTVRSRDLEGSMVALTMELEKARGELKAREASAVDRDAAERKREEDMRDQIAAIEARAAEASLNVAEVNRLLEAERARNVELMKLREAREQDLERQIAAMQSMSIENALREIETLEQEYQLLEASSLARQDELIKRTDQLERAALLADGEMAELRAALAREREIRARVEAREAEREKAVKDANAALAAASEDMARQLESVRRDVAAHKGEIKLGTERPRDGADLAPAMAQIEAAAKAAAREAEQLRRQIADEQRIHADDVARDAKKIAGLEERVAALEKDKAVSAQTLADARQAVETQKRTHEAMLRQSRETEKQLRLRISDLEHAYRGQPTTGPVAPPVPAVPSASTNDASAPEVVEDTSPSAGILEVVRTNKAAAVALYEAMPASAARSPDLLRTLAGAYRENHEFGKALALYEDLLRQVPGDLQAERKLVMTLFDMGRYDDALERLAGPAAAGAEAGAPDAGSKPVAPAVGAGAR